MRLQLLRHATVFLEYAGLHFLIDPCLDPKGSQPAILSKRGISRRNNPLQDLPLSDKVLSQRFADLDFILITHLHQDHLSGLSLFPELLEVPILAPEYALGKLKSKGFSEVLPLKESCRCRKVNISLLPFRHGNWIQRAFLGKSHGYFLSSPGEPPFLLTGDAVWDFNLKDSIQKHSPQVILANAGAAVIPFGGAITLDSQGIQALLQHSSAQVVAVHFESYNHCRESRAYVRNSLSEPIQRKILAVPEDGEVWEPTPELLAPMTLI